jgi:hypothetical protein
MSDEPVTVEIDYGDGTVEQLEITEGFTSFHPYDDNQKYEVEVTVIDDGGGEESPSTVTSIDPTTAEIGAADITLRVLGTGFNEQSVILFNNGEEPTTFVSVTEVTTTVKPSTASGPWTVPVGVKDATGTADFTFTEPAAPEVAADEFDPDAPDQEWEADAAFDPAAHTVTEVIGYVEDNPDQREAVLELERAGKDRVTLISHLEGMA